MSYHEIEISNTRVAPKEGRFSGCRLEGYLRIGGAKRFA